jgi:hypothetical protein
MKLRESKGPDGAHRGQHASASALASALFLPAAFNGFWKPSGVLLSDLANPLPPGRELCILPGYAHGPNL